MPPFWCKMDAKWQGGIVSAIEPVSADALLGGRAVFARAPRSGLEWVDVVRHGISSRALDSMLKSIGLSQAELATNPQKEKNTPSYSSTVAPSACSWA